MKTLFIALRSLVYMTGFILLFGWIALGVRSFDREFGLVLPAWTGIAGIVIMLVGASLALACAATFVVKGRGTPAVFDPPSEFLSVGPYKYVRNPMYIGGFILLVGFGLYQRSVSILLLSLVLLLLTHLAVVSLEEPNLEKRFGQSYIDYKKSVSRWVPKWKRGISSGQ